MKKKIFLMLSMAILLVCVFAISVSAVEKDGIYYTIEGTGENAYAKVSTENRDNCTLETVEIPATIEVDGVTYKVTEIDKNAFGQVNGDVNGFIKHLVIGENVSVVGVHAFRRVTTLQTVKIQNTNAAAPINFDDAQFYNCTGLTSVSAVNAKVSAYGPNCFYNCSNLETVDYPATLQSIGSDCFRLCGKLTSGDISNTQIVSISSWAYGSCSTITEFKFPSTLESIGNNCFLYCPVETYVFPHSMKSFGKDMLAYQSKIKVLIMPAVDANTTGINNFLYSTKPNVVIYAGDNVEYFKGLSGNFSGYDVQPFENYVPGTTYQKNTIFYGAGKTCSICNGFLAESDNPCVTDCTYCGAVNVPKANPVHNIATTITYASYDSTGTKTVGCINEGCPHNTTEELPALFNCLGYSAPEFGTEGIVVGYEANDTAIKEYEKLTNTTLTYGVFAVSQKKLGDNAIFGENGAAEGVISADVTKHGFNLFEIKVVGFTDEQKSLNLAMGAYVAVTDGEETTYSYMQDDKKGEKIGEYFFVSYNEIAGNPSTEEPAQ